MTLTDRQREALDVLLVNDNVLLFGGARSGKTALIVYFLYYCALQFPGIRMLVTRLYATDIRASIWNDTLQKVARLLGLVLGKEYKTNEQSMSLTFPNGSEIICAGLDDKERVDKILGTEYGIIYVNESQDVPWTTVKVIKTRLAQRVEGFRNKFICDLNPTSINHWTYRVWFDGLVPDEDVKVKGRYGKLQMNPGDNRENLAEGFIEEQLESLTGEERKRFLLGEYSANSDLQVFRPAAVHADLAADFRRWAEGRWRQVEVTAGLDFGYEDADAYAMLAYIDGEPDVWLIEEYKGVKNSVTQLGKDMGKAIDDAWTRYPFPSHAREGMDIWSDTGGLGRKTAQELADTLELPVRQAYKRDKEAGIYFLQDDVNAGRLHIQDGSHFHDETKKVVWQRNRETGKVERVIDDKAFHPDMMDAVLYAYRYLMKSGNGAMIGRTSGVVKDTAPKGAFDILAEVERALGQEAAVW